MASTNQSPFYRKAESEFLQATNDEERITCLEIMIKECPKHKSSENMLANLKTRLKKLKASLAKQKKSRRGGGDKGIKKADVQIVIVGFPNTGKSSLFKALAENSQDTNISPHPFSTLTPVLGTTKIEDIQAQLIDMPPFPNHDKSTLNSTDTILLVIDNLEQIKEAEKHIYRANAYIITIFNKADLLTLEEKRKLEAKLKSNKIESVIFSSTDATSQEINELKNKILSSFIPKKVIRIYTKEPKKSATKDPMILKPDSTVRDAAEKILKGMAKKVKQTRIWGPSSKFSGQVVGLDHKIKDRDTIEFQTK